MEGCIWYPVGCYNRRAPWKGREEDGRIVLLLLVLVRYWKQILPPMDENRQRLIQRGQQTDDVLYESICRDRVYEGLYGDRRIDRLIELIAKQNNIQMIISLHYS